MIASMIVIALLAVLIAECWRKERQVHIRIVHEVARRLAAFVRTSRGTQR